MIKRSRRVSQLAGEPANPPPSRWMPLSTARLDMLLSVIAGVYASDT
jgi:hypothetical protein